MATDRFESQETQDDISELSKSSYISSDGATQSLPNGVATLIESINVEPGTYIVLMSAQFDANATGKRSVGNNNTIPSGPRNGVTTVDAVSGGTYTTIQHIDIYYSGGGNINCYCYQNSGAALTVWTKIQAIRLY